MNRRATLILRPSSLIAVLPLALLTSMAAGQGPYQATGIKVGEVTDTSAVIWTRLTRLPERIGSEAAMPEFLYQTPENDALQEALPIPPLPHDWVPFVRYPDGSSIEFIEGAVVGAAGETRVLYRPANASEWRATSWRAVNPERDFTRQFTLTDLMPSTSYELRVEGRRTGSEAVSSSLDGSLRSAPEPDQQAPITFAAVTGTEYPDQDAPEGGFRIHQAMMDLGIDFFVHTGDILYYDEWAKDLDLARWGWARMFSLPTHTDFHRQVPTYFMKDDHDTWLNDTWPSQQSTLMGNFTFQQGLEVFREQVPMSESTYRTFRWGQDLQIWLVEGRDFRSANTDPDGPGKTIWGAEQKAWFRRSVAASDAAFRVLISPTPLVGPDRDNKNDSHANQAFAFEGRELREFIARQDNMIVICGDRHWQYVSVDAETGVREYATGSASDAHAGGWSNDDYRSEHRYLNVIGGFLSVTAERIDGVPTLTMRHHGVDGEVLNEDVLTAD